MGSIAYHLIDLLKIVLPLLAFFFLFRTMIKKNHESLMVIVNSKINEKRAASQLKMRLQALERMALYAERIDLQALVHRLYETPSSADQLYYSMIIAMQEELEHNITQQLYVSDNLWKIIYAARDHQVSVLNQLKEGLEKDATGKQLVERINWYSGTQNDDVLDTVRRAIKEESKMLL